MLTLASGVETEPTDMGEVYKINKVIMKVARSIIFLCFTLLFAGAGFAQKDFTEEADIAFKSETYFSAKELYKKAYTKENKRDEKTRILFRIGECYRLIQDPKQAEGWYKKAIAAGYKGSDAVLFLADALRYQGRYDEALVEYQKYMAMEPSDPRGSNGAQSCELAAGWEKNPSRYVVNNEVLLNTKQYDFSPTFADKKFESLVFTSTRPGASGTDIDENFGEGFSDLYITSRDKKGKWSVPSPVGETVNSEGNEGSAVFDRKYGTLYFTRCQLKKNKKMGCGIYQARKQGKNFAEAEILDLGGKDSTVFGHPCLYKNDEYLFFASDMPGGHGGKDIWYTVFDKKARAWGKPINLGPEINTSKNEMFPFVRNDGSLYFASDGHPGMGGLDIFSSKLTGEDQWGEIENMGFPINSASHDFGIIFEGDKDRGYLTSSRNGTKGGDDIYSFYKPPVVFKIQGVITDVETSQPIPGAKITLVGTDGTSVEVESDEVGYYEFDQKPDKSGRYVLANTSYSMTVSKPKYLNAKGQETTVGVDVSTAFVHDYKLQPFSEAIEFPEVLYDLAKWTLKPESKDSLEFLFKVLVDNPNIVIELAAHTDSRGSNAANQVLSQKRAESCVSFLIEKGIPGDRMVARGYGEDKLRITDAQINALATKEEREAAHQKNRRTVFRVLRDDYVPSASGGGGGGGSEAPN